MESERFDALMRRAVREASRRGVLRGGIVTFATSVLALVGLGRIDVAEAGGKCKPACGECQSCKKGSCKKTKQGKKCKKGKCQALPEGTPCSNGTCQSGTCVAPVTPPPPDPPPFCAGKNTCAAGATCNQPDGLQCLCFVAVGTGAPHCGLSSTLEACTAASGCAPGSTCVDLAGCGFATGCSEACPDPL